MLSYVYFFSIVNTDHADTELVLGTFTNMALSNEIKRDWTLQWLRAFGPGT